MVGIRVRACPTTSPQGKDHHSKGAPHQPTLELNFLSTNSWNKLSIHQPRHSTRELDGCCCVDEACAEWTVFCGLSESSALAFRRQSSPTASLASVPVGQHAAQAPEHRYHDHLQREAEFRRRPTTVEVLDGGDDASTQPARNRHLSTPLSPTTCLPLREEHKLWGAPVSQVNRNPASPPQVTTQN
jgi:hypothetical protein